MIAVDSNVLLYAHQAETDLQAAAKELLVLAKGTAAWGLAGVLRRRVNPGCHPPAGWGCWGSWSNRSPSVTGRVGVVVFVACGRPDADSSTCDERKGDTVSPLFKRRDSCAGGRLRLSRRPFLSHSRSSEKRSSKPRSPTPPSLSFGTSHKV